MTEIEEFIGYNTNEDLFTEKMRRSNVLFNQEKKRHAFIDSRNPDNVSICTDYLFTVEKDPLFVSLDPQGSYGIYRRNGNHLIQLYESAIKNGYLMTLAEKQPNYSMLVVDIDISDENNTTIRPLYKKGDVLAVYESYKNSITSLCRDVDQSLLEAVLLQKNPYITKEGKLKHGFHLQFLNIFASKELRVRIREKASMSLSHKPDSIESNFWLLPGSAKSMDLEPYMPTYIISMGKIEKAVKIPFSYLLMSCLNDNPKKVFLEGKISASFKPLQYKKNDNPVLNPEDDEIIVSYLERVDQFNNFTLQGSRLIRISAGPCIVDPRIDHERDNSYIIKNGDSIYVGCYRGCTCNGKKTVKICQKENVLPRMMTVEEMALFL
jgi:hypothetical protein